MGCLIEKVFENTPVPMFHRNTHHPFTYFYPFEGFCHYPIIYKNDCGSFFCNTYHKRSGRCQVPAGDVVVLSWGLRHRRPPQKPLAGRSRPAGEMRHRLYFLPGVSSWVGVITMVRVSAPSAGKLDGVMVIFSCGVISFKPSSWRNLSRGANWRMKDCWCDVWA